MWSTYGHLDSEPEPNRRLSPPKTKYSRREFSFFIETHIPNTLQDVVFFYKAHILAGQVRPDPDRYQDFAWLTKGEISKRTDADYWLGIKDMLSDF